MTVITAADVQDLTGIVDLERAALAPGWTEGQLQDALGDPSSILLVARRKNRVIGYVSYRSVLDEAELLRLAVLPDDRRRGVAAALLVEGRTQLLKRAVGRCFLEVRADNLGALAFYQGQGFEEAGRRPRYYPDGEDAVLMKSSL